MSEQNIAEEMDHYKDQLEIERRDAGFDQPEAETHATNPQKMFAWVLTAVIVGLIAIVGLVWIVSKRSVSRAEAETAQTEESTKSETGREVKLEPEALAAAGIVIESVTQRPAIAKLYVTGSVELNPEKTEMATPLVGGRIEQVFYGVGDHVIQGAVLAMISSPQVAQLHGKMHDA